MIPKTWKGHNDTRTFLVGLLIRIGITILFPFIFDDGVLLDGVKYTDIDYQVFTDAARHVSNAGSPYDRHTYRYSPFVAKILSFADDESSGMIWWRNYRYFGKLIFCISDSLCGLIILQHRRMRRETKFKMESEFISDELQDALWWLYNPIPINICTRGSAESFIVLFSVLVTVTIALSDAKSKKELRLKSLLAGIMHGVAVHGKLYPIIYTLSFMVYFSRRECALGVRVERNIDTRKNMMWRKLKSPTCHISDEKEKELLRLPWFHFSRLYHLIKLWIHRILSSTSILFGISFLSSFGILTCVSVYFYGSQALTEGLLYHFSRVDHRHNYSMFWYWIYLARGRVASQIGSTTPSSLSFMGRALLLPQIILIVYSSLGIAPYDLEFALFLQTFLFIALNKVITAQYFTWYLVLLPLCSERIRWRTKNQYVALSFLGLTIILWLLSAFSLEMKGMSSYLLVWIASVGFFIGNLNLLVTICSNYKIKSDTFLTFQDEQKLKSN